jgi:hypothetical protein
MTQHLTIGSMIWATDNNKEDGAISKGFSTPLSLPFSLLIAIRGSHSTRNFYKGF